MRRKHVFSLLMLSMGVALLVAATTVGAASSATRKVSSSKALRGGTLQINQSAGALDTLDPQLAYVTNDWEVLGATQVMLLNYPDKGGSAGNVLTPEVAKSYPTISKNGKVYTYHLRSGLRFSDGSKVTAKAFQRAFERILSPKMYAQYGIYDGLDTDLVGGQAFAGTGPFTGKPTTKHVSGVKAKGLKLTIHLTKRVPYFTSLLALQWFGAVKPNMKYTNSLSGILTYPSAGPYYIATNKLPVGPVVLKRNKYYHGVRPAYPNKIVIHNLTDPERSLLQIEKNQVDYDMAGVPFNDVKTLAQKYGYPKNKHSQFHVGGTGCLYVLGFNDAIPPTNNVKVREALNYAIGRTPIISLLGPYAGTATDQVLVPGVPGYKRYSIYPNYPNLAKAEEVGGSALKDAVSLTIAYLPSNALSTNRAEYEQAQIEQIGLTANLVSEYDQPSTQDNIFPSGWCPDYLDPFDYSNTIFTGANGFDNSSFEQKAQQAASLYGKARASAYAALDKLLMANYAPVFPLDIPNTRYLVSKRVHNIVYSNYYGAPILNAMSVR